MTPLPARGIDHIVLAVRDLAEARGRYTRLGFTTTPRADHPFGTSNSLVQLDGNFIELLAVTDRSRLVPATPGQFSFGAFNEAVLAHREGMTMLVFQSADARADLEEFRRAGLSPSGPVDFSRQATLPDGRQVTVAFSLAFVTDGRLPEAAFFVCQQHAPEHFWKREYQKHRNGALQIAEAVLVVSDPPAFAALFARMQRHDQVRVERDSVRVTTARGGVTVLSPAGFEERYPGSSAIKSGQFGAIRLSVLDLVETELLMKAAGAAPRRDQGRLWIDAPQGNGLVLEFSA
jgi:catechol 2,3-dioxygenase-like lactoylglutathione lyase family enzyme